MTTITSYLLKLSIRISALCVFLAARAPSTSFFSRGIIIIMRGGELF